MIFRSKLRLNINIASTRDLHVYFFYFNFTSILHIFYTYKGYRMKIGHNKSPHQINTKLIPILGIDFIFYNRTDLVNTSVWHFRVKAPVVKRFGEDETIKWKRISTGTADFDRARDNAWMKYTEWKIMAEHEIPLFQATFESVATDVIAQINKQAERGDIAADTARMHRSKMTRFILPYFGSKQIKSITRQNVLDFWEWRRNYWVEHKDDPRVNRLPASENIGA